MTGPRDELAHRAHDEAEELLPWYATGQLDEQDRVRVEAHLTCCARCREQLSLERRLITEFRATTPQLESGWARVKARIVQPDVDTRPGASSFMDQFLTVLRRPAVAAVAFAQLALLIVGGGVVLSLTEPAYHTLSSARAPAAANLIVMFKAQASLGHVGETLRSSRASLVGGPTAANAYLLHVDRRDREAALARLRHDGAVELAEPIDGVDE